MGDTVRILPLGGLLGPALLPGNGLRLAIPLLVAWALAVVWLVMKRWRSPVRGLVQVHLSASGCCQIDSCRVAASASELSLTPWHQIEQVVVETIWVGGPAVRITLGERAQWGLSRQVRVDAEVQGGPDVAAALTLHIRQWRDAAAAGAPTGGSAAAPLNRT